MYENLKRESKNEDDRGKSHLGPKPETIAKSETLAYEFFLPGMRMRFGMRGIWLNADKDVKTSAGI